MVLLVETFKKENTSVNSGWTLANGPADSKTEFYFIILFSHNIVLVYAVLVVFLSTLRALVRQLYSGWMSSVRWIELSYSYNVYWCIYEKKNSFFFLKTRKEFEINYKHIYCHYMLVRCNWFPMKLLNSVRTKHV